MFSGSIPALITPFENGGETIDYEQMRKLIVMHIRDQSDALVIGGTTGEGPTYSTEEYQKVVETSIEASDGLIDVIVTSGTNVTKQSIERTQIAKASGAKGALTIIPYYNKPSFAGITCHFEAIAKVGLPLIVYHHPGRTGITLTAEEIVTLHEIEGVVGIKEASDDPTLTARICALMPDALILSGNDDLALEVIKNGGRGSISIIANLVPALWHDLMTNPNQEELISTLKPLIEAVGLEVNPQGIKCAMALAGYCKNILRLPLLPACSVTQEKIAAANLLCMNSL